MGNETCIKVDKVTELGMQMQKAVDGIGKVTNGDIIRVVLYTLMTSRQCSELYGNNMHYDDDFVYDQIAKIAMELMEDAQKVNVIVNSK